MTSLIDREDFWNTLTRKQDAWDVVIIGGGITGAGILYQAALHGLSAVLFEQKDFAWGTSSRTTKMVHGGLRYITQGDLKLTKQSVQERDHMLRAAPGLVEQMDFLFPIRKGQLPGKLVLNSLLAIYDKLAGTTSHGYLDEKKLKLRIPALNADNLKGASYYTDAVTDDARLVLRVLHAALHQGALAGNYMQVQKLLLDQSDNVSGVQVNNITNGKSLHIRARTVVNATGAWSDSLREPVSGERTIRPLRGSHIVIPHQYAPVTDALTLFHPQDKRAVFILPWEQTTLVGTTDLDHKTSLSIEPEISQAELNYLLTLVKQQFPGSDLQKEHIISSYAGVRPVISKDRSKPPSKEKREHKVWQDKNLISVSGGKLTTFRLIALDVIGIILQNIKPEVTVDENSPPLETATTTERDLALDNPGLSRRLIGSYGNYSLQIKQNARGGELRPITTTRFCLAELRWAARQEAVVHLDDLLLRRTRLGLLIPGGAASQLDSIKTICQEELGWSDAIWKSEKQRYLHLWAKHYSLPKTHSNKVV